MLFSLRSDEALVRAAVEGRRGAFAQLVRRYQNLVYSTILAHVPRREDAEDLAQETFVKAYVNLTSLDDARRFGAWLRRIARNEAASHLRRKEPVPADQVPFPLTATEQPDEAVMMEERDLEVWEVTRSLPEDLREVVLLHYMEEQPVARIAAYLGLSASAVRARLAKARATLRSSLLDRRLRRSLGSHKLRRRFGKRVSAALLMLVPRKSAAQTALVGLTWGAAMLASGVLVGKLADLGDGGPGAALTDPDEGVQVRLMTSAGYARFLDIMRFGELEGPESVYGSSTLGDSARRQERRALRSEQGGRLAWNFDNGVQGWYARARGDDQPLLIRKRDGALVVDLADLFQRRRSESVEFISPEIGYACRLFDRVRVRWRVLGGNKVECGLQLSWTNPVNRLMPGQDPTRLRTVDGALSAAHAPADRMASTRRDARAGSAWQITEWSRVGTGAGELWTGTLSDIRIDFHLSHPRVGERSPGEGEGIQALEVDWIEVGRSSAAPLDLPVPELVRRRASGSWLTRGAVTRLPVRQFRHPRHRDTDRDGLADALDEYTQPSLQAPVVGDFDGDGDLDVVIGYTEPRSSDRRMGWYTLVNQGDGRFNVQKIHELPRPVDPGGHGAVGHLFGADLDADGAAGLVARRGLDTHVYAFDPGMGWRCRRSWYDYACVGVADIGGDGDVDLVMDRFERSADSTAGRWADMAYVLENEGEGHFSFHPAYSAPGSWAPWAMGDFDADGRVELISVRPARRSGSGLAEVLVLSGWARGRWTERAVVEYAGVPDAGEYGISVYPQHVGDLDNDTKWDVGVPVMVLRDGQVLNAGMRIVGNERPAEVCLPPQVHLSGIHPMRPWTAAQTHDLNGDGLTDAVFADVNYRRGAALLVLAGRRGRLPEREGVYPLHGEPRGWAAGDMDGDGRKDVVVVLADAQGGAVQVWRNVSGTGRTSGTPALVARD